MPVGGGGRSELKDGRTGKCYADSMGYNRVIDEIASVFVLGALLVESRNGIAHAVTKMNASITKADTSKRRSQSKKLSDT